MSRKQGPRSPGVRPSARAASVRNSARENPFHDNEEAA